MLEQAYAILDRAIEEHKPSHIFGMFSGGNDSLVATHVLMHYAQERAFNDAYCPTFLVAHMNTGIGIEQTRQFVRNTCQQYGWILKEYHAGTAYDDLVKQRGFPGPAAHRYMYINLKERSIDRLVREHKQFLHDRIMLVTGARRQESQRRMGTVQDIWRMKTRVWVNPLADWSKSDVLDYKEEQHLPHNEVVDILHMSGECLCGAYAKAGEFDTINLFYPETGCRIRTLAAQVHDAGFPQEWGERSSSKKK